MGHCPLHPAPCFGVHLVKDFARSAMLIYTTILLVITADSGNKIVDF
jgi:hypothetical protein